MDKKLLKATDVAKILNVRRERIYELVRRKMLPAVRIGRQMRFQREAIVDFIERGGLGLEGDQNERS